LVAVPFDFGVGIVTTFFEEHALVKHLIVLVNQNFRLSDGHVIEFVLVVSALFLESLARIFLLSLDSLKLSKVLAIWEVALETVLG
jgi:hypothetical protein